MTVCRGCGGTGLDHSLSPRTFAIATREIMLSKPSRFNDVKSSAIATVRIGPKTEPRNGNRLTKYPRIGPLAVVLATVEHLRTLNYEPEHELDPEWACEWCSGTGVPQLTAPYLTFITTKEAAHV